MSFSCSFCAANTAKRQGRTSLLKQFINGESVKKLKILKNGTIDIDEKTKKIEN